MGKSIEALWTARFGDINQPNAWLNGGVVVFESGNMYGGDGGTYYIGSFKVSEDQFEAAFKTVIYDPRYESVFGNIGSEVEIKAKGKRASDDLIVGEMYAIKFPDLKVSFDLTYRATLP
ncbi:GrlR family regulatory protein [Kordiimonas aquimaris]|uniref:GrlR family regulatory protein n=1 Tax=Kordiimonas aquimaris TaxID=707591 RepID=UPI0021CF7EFC|nr:GrlR family regulatory protein [Kordiimonas aquimaris]